MSTRLLTIVSNMIPLLLALPKRPDSESGTFTLGVNASVKIKLRFECEKEAPY